MLRALKKQINDLAANEHDHFTMKVWNCLGKGRYPEESAALKNFVQLLPDMIAQIRIWADDQKVPEKIKRLHGFVLTYLYHPLDLIPEEPYGLFGYLDDAYLVGDVYHRTMMHAKADSLTKEFSNDFSVKMAGWLALTRKVLPSETKKIDWLLDELVKGNDQAFHDLIAQTDAEKAAR